MEMKERFCRVFGAEAAVGLHFSTIHSFCLSVLKRAANAYGVHVPALEPDNGKIVRRVFFSRFFEYPSDIVTNELCRYIGYSKNQMYTEDQLETFDTSSFDFGRFYTEYEDYKQKNDIMDFDDQLLLAYRMLEDCPAILEAIRERYRYINVDEAQDTSMIQHKIISKIAGRTRNLFMVGDEDQSIYGFRAAYPDALLRFSKDYPGAEILLMETNYRCAANIVSAADLFIRQNRGRYQKIMRSVREEGHIHETKLHDASRQYVYLRDSLGKAFTQGKQVAVLYRNNESAIPLVDLLEKAGIPFNGDVSMMYFEHLLVKDIVFTLRLAKDPCDLEAYKAIYFKFGLFTTKAQCNDVCSHIQNRFSSAEAGKTPERGASVFKVLADMADDGESRQRILAFALAMDRIERLSASDALEAVETLFYRAWIKRLNSEGRDSVHGQEQKLSTLYALAMEHRTIGDFLKRIGELRVAGTRGRSETPSTITLSTIHSSKGMEFDKVILIDVIRGILPSEKGTGLLGSADENHYEEEVRLFYVGVTRAKNEIEAVTAQKRFGKAIAPSPFLLELLGKGVKHAEENRKADEKRDAAAHTAGQKNGDD